MSNTDSTQPDDQASDVRQYVTFCSGNEVFAVELSPVQEIIRLPDVVRVPLGPRTLDGLANLRGKVLPIISLRRAFGFADVAYDDASRALVIDLGQPLGFVVDRVVSVVGVESSRLERVTAGQGGVNSELLAGIIKDVGGHPMIMVLDFARLIAQELTQLGALTKRAASTTGIAGQAEQEEEVSEEMQLVSLEVAGQEYAIAIDEVQEIVHVPTTIVQVPHSASHVLGVMTLRERLLPLVSLRRMFGLAAQALDDQSRIVVVSVGSSSVGIVTDRVNEVLRVAKADVDAMPGVFAREAQLADVSGLCRLNGGKRLVSIISVANLFRHSSIKEAINTVAGHHDHSLDNETTERTEDEEDDEQVVVFRLANEEFGAPIASVQEIVRVPETLTHVPNAPPFVEGVINLRGAVLPVVDLRRRLGMPAIARTDRQRVMVFLINDVRTGFIVDSVAEVLRIPKALIEPTPPLSAEQSKVLTRMANLEKQKRLLQLIEPANLFQHSVELAECA